MRKRWWCGSRLLGMPSQDSMVAFPSISWMPRLPGDRVAQPLRSHPTFKIVLWASSPSVHGRTDVRIGYQLGIRRNSGHGHVEPRRPSSNHREGYARASHHADVLQQQPRRVHRVSLPSIGKRDSLLTFYPVAYLVMLQDFTIYRTLCK